MTNLDRILKSRDITLSIKVHLVKAMVFPVVMYKCESWTIKKAECWRINVLELWCWRRLLRVPWTARRSNQSIRKEISPEYSLEGLMLKLKLQYFGHLMGRTDSLEKTLMLGKIEGRRRRGRQRMRWLDGITDSMDMSLTRPGDWWQTGKPGVLQSMGSQRVRHDWATELNWSSPKPPSHPDCCIILSRVPRTCYTVGPCWLSILNIAVCTWLHSKCSIVQWRTYKYHCCFIDVKPRNRQVRKLAQGHTAGQRESWASAVSSHTKHRLRSKWIIVSEFRKTSYGSFYPVLALK